MAKLPRNPSREQFWRDAIAAWQGGGLTVRDFCRQRQLTETSFHHRRRELRQRDAAAAPRTEPPAFVPGTVVTVPQPPAPELAGPVEVRCPSGHAVTLPGADAATLRVLFAALAEVRP